MTRKLNNLKPRIAIIGSSGKIGKMVQKYYPNEFIFIDRGPFSQNKNRITLEFDLLETSFDNLIDYLIKANIDGVVLLSGQSSPKACESDPITSENVNVRGPKLIAEAIQRQDISLILMSSEYVYSGSNGKHNELSASPKILYGEQKFRMEAASVLANVTVLRIPKIYWVDFNSPCLFGQTYRQLTDNSESIYVATDQIFTPLIGHDLVRVWKFIVSHKITGIFNVGQLEPISRHAFVSSIFELKSSILGNNLICKPLPCLLDEFVAKDYPKDTSLDSSLIMTYYRDSFTDFKSAITDWTKF